MINKELTLTIKILKDELHYDDISGEFFWNGKRNNAKAGSLLINSNSKKHYWALYVNGYSYMAHRVAWFYTYGSWPNQIDHEDGNGLNNSLSNLRNVGDVENQKNKKLYSCNKSGISGVYITKSGKWLAVVRHNSYLYRLGTFKDFFDAICARKSAENKYGFHVNHGAARPL